MAITSTGLRRAAARPIFLPRLAAVPFWLWSLGLALLAAGALLWPLPVRLHTHALDLGDGLHLAWVLRYTQINLWHPGAGFGAPAGCPYDQALLLNPPLTSAALLGMPLFALGWSATAVLNALTLLSFALACWALMLLGRRLTGSVLAGCVAGLLYAFADVRLAHIAHLNLLSGFWTAMLLGLLLAAWRTPPRTRRGLVALAIGAGLLAAAQALGDVYNAIYMVAMAGLLGACWGVGVVYAWMEATTWGRPYGLRHSREARLHIAAHPTREAPTAPHVRRPTTDAQRPALAALGALAAGALLALALTAPVLLPTLSAWRELGVARAWADHEALAARPAHYLVATHERPLYDLSELRSRGLAADPVEQRLWPGALALALAAVGLVAGPRERRRERLFLGVLALAAFVLSLGPRLELPGRSVELPWYRWLFEHAPLFAAARVPARWALLLQLALAGLAALGAARLVGLAPARARAALGLALLACTLADVRPTSIHLTDDLVGEPVPAVYRALAAMPAGALLEWPLENASPTLKHRQQHYTLAHGHPIVNSAASAPPPRYAELHAFLRAFPEGGSVALLRELGVRYVVVSRWEIGDWGSLAPRLEAAQGLRLLGTYDEGRHLLYAVLAEPQPEPAPVAALSGGADNPRISLAVAAPLWLAPPGQLYRGDRPTTVPLRLADGRTFQATLALPPVLLPGSYSWELPAAAATATAALLGDTWIPLAAAPAMHGDGPLLAAGALPARLVPGAALPCLAFGQLPAREGLVLAAALVDSGWNVVAKVDHFLAPGAGAAPLACGLTLPAGLPPGDYFLALGLYDPAAGAFVPVQGQDGARSEGLLRVAGPLAVGT